MIGYTLGKAYDKTLGKILPLPVFLFDVFAFGMRALHNVIAKAAGATSSSGVFFLFKPVMFVLSKIFTLLKVVTSFAVLLSKIAIVLTIVFLLLRLIKLVKRIKLKQKRLKAVKGGSDTTMKTEDNAGYDQGSYEETIDKRDLNKVDAFH